ncbi:MAG: PHP domain-containing protein [Marinilabiliales bacterium]|nr:PHP domain-containing protein [Marinilabiliales bacterium]
MKADGMEAVAITDRGNIVRSQVKFHNEAKKQGIKPILGCEVYVAWRSRFEKSDKSDGGGFHLVLLAKNLSRAIRNLIKMVSYGWTEGLYYRPGLTRNCCANIMKDCWPLQPVCMAKSLATAARGS